MGHEHFGGGGWWAFPVAMPLVIIIFLIIFLYLVFGRGGPKRPWADNSEGPSNHNKDSETALEITKKRYARGEITREEFEQIRKDLES
jgi:putative membrane protein